MKIGDKIFYGKKYIARSEPLVIEGAVINGEDWAVYDKDGGYVFEYMTGGLVDKLKTISITPEDVAALKSGEMTGHDVVLRFQRQEAAAGRRW